MVTITMMATFTTATVRKGVAVAVLTVLKTEPPVAAVAMAGAANNQQRAAKRVAAVVAVATAGADNNQQRAAKMTAAGIAIASRGGSLGCAFRRNSVGFRRKWDKSHRPERNGPGTGTGM